jgi:hypothetical protein
MCWADGEGVAVLYELCDLVCGHRVVAGLGSA